MKDKRNLVMFDLGHMFIRGDTFLRYISFAIAHLLRLRDKEWLKTTVLPVFLKRRKMWDVCEPGKRFVRELLPYVRPAALDRLSYHRNQGHYTVLATASPYFHLEFINESVDFDEILCTKIAWSSN